MLQTICLDHGRRNIREILCSLLALGRHDDVAGAIPPVDGTKARSPRRVHQGTFTKARSPRRVHQGAYTRARTPGRVPRSSKLDSTTDVAACGQDSLKGQALTSSLVHGRRNAATKKTLRHHVLKQGRWHISVSFGSTTDVATCGQDPPKGQASTSSVHGRRRR